MNWILWHRMKLEFYIASYCSGITFHTYCERMSEIIHAEHNCYHRVGNYITQVECPMNERLFCVCVFFFSFLLHFYQVKKFVFFSCPLSRLDYGISSEMVDAIGSTFNMPNKYDNIIFMDKVIYWELLIIVIQLRALKYFCQCCVSVCQTKLRNNFHIFFFLLQFYFISNKHPAHLHNRANHRRWQKLNRLCVWYKGWADLSWALIGYFCFRLKFNMQMQMAIAGCLMPMMFN